MVLTTPFVGRLNATRGPKFTLLAATGGAVVAIVGLALLHAHPFEIYLWPIATLTCLNAAFASMPLLVLDAVPAELRGQSTAANAIIRSVGSSFGLQLSATVVSVTAVASAMPAESGFVYAFLLQAGALSVAFLLALRIPGRAEQAQGAAVRELPALAGGPTPS
jgi:hypothetical protein